MAKSVLTIGGAGSSGRLQDCDREGRDFKSLGDRLY